MLLERRERGIALELNRENLWEELRQTALPERLLRVRHEHKAAARLKNSGTFRKTRREIIDVVDRVDRKDEPTGLITDRECSRSVSD